MAKNKTVPTKSSVEEFLDKVEPAQKREDAYILKALMQKVTGEPAVMWGSSIVGFGKYHYIYESGREGDMPMVGFSPRKQSLTLYVLTGQKGEKDLFAKLGKHTTSKACLYINKLSDVDMDVLEKIIKNAYTYMQDSKDAK